MKSLFQYDHKSLIESIYAGTTTLKKLPKNLYSKISTFLRDGLYEGFGGDITSFETGTAEATILTELRANIYLFSAAKTFNQVYDIEKLKTASALLTSGEKIAPFKEFKEAAEQVFEKYNKTWLKTEYDTAIGQAQNARKWQDFEADKELFPMLEYDTVGDENVCRICAPLNGIIREVDDPFWNKFAPMQHFGCKCMLRKIDKYSDAKVTSQKVVEAKAKVADELMSPVFKSNPGKDGMIFNPQHGYFSIPKKYVPLAKENFGLKVPKKD